MRLVTSNPQPYATGVCKRCDGSRCEGTVSGCFVYALYLYCIETLRKLCGSAKVVETITNRCHEGFSTNFGGRHLDPKQQKLRKQLAEGPGDQTTRHTSPCFGKMSRLVRVLGRAKAYIEECKVGEGCAHDTMQCMDTFEMCVFECCF